MDNSKTVTEKSIGFKEFVKEHDLDLDLTRELIENADVVLLPEKLHADIVMNSDVMNISKLLINNGIKVKTIRKPGQIINVVEHRTADILLNIGIIASDKILDMLFAVVGSYIFYRYLYGKKLEEKNIPVVKIKYYDLKEGKYVEIEQRADKMLKEGEVR
jgi:uncharacterized protein (DUF488 family)